MLSVLRSVPRQPRWLDASLAATIASRRGYSSLPDAKTLSDVGQMFRKAGQEDHPSESGGSSNSEDVSQLLVSEHTNLRGFRFNDFVSPKSFTRKDREVTRRFFKRALLGPSAEESRKLDPFYQLNLDPLDECQNSTLMSDFVTEMGKIRSRAQTNLTWKNQRRLGKAIRRARMMGIIPVLSRRPLDFF